MTGATKGMISEAFTRQEHPLQRGLGVLSQTPSWLLIYAVSCVVELSLGFLLAYGLISRIIANPHSRGKAENIRSRPLAYE